MPNSVIVRINEKLIPEFQIKYDESKQTSIRSDVSSWAEIKPEKDQQLILLLAANLCYSTRVKIPSKNEEVIRQSLPFAIEEELSNDVSDNHCAYVALDEQVFEVTVVGKDILEKVIQEIKEYKLKSFRLYSEVYTCPFQDENLTVCLYDSYALVRNGCKEASIGTCIDKNLIASYIKLSKAKNITVFANKKIKFGTAKNINCQQIDVTQLSVNTLLSENAVNIFQGTYNQQSQSKRAKHPWKKSLLLALLVLISWLLISLTQLWQLSSSIDEIKESQKSFLLKWYPKASSSELLDPYSAILSRLKQNKSAQNTQNNAGFVMALESLGQTLKKFPQIQIEALRQRQTKLEIKLQANSVSELNKFQQQLENNLYSMRVKTGTRDSNDKGINSVITLEQLQ